MNWIGYRVLDSLITYPDAWFLSRTAFPIQKEGQWIGAPIDGLLKPPRASSTPAQHTNNLSPCAQRDHNLQRTEAPHTVLLRCRAANGVAHTPDTAHPTHHSHPAHDTPPSAARPRHGAGLVPLPRALASRAPRTAASGPHQPRVHNAHTKRARTNRSGRATYSAQALGRLPWFAPCLRRSRRLRPRFDMSFSLGLLSRLKHFCTHWPKPPRHRPFAATKVTEKRAATPASSARAPRRDHASSQRP